MGEADLGARRLVTVLAISTSTAQVGVALAGPEGVMASLRLKQGRRHGETVAPAIQALMRMSAVSPPQLTVVAVDRGPGLFTGLRVGVATAKALASALGIPVASATSLDLLARPLLQAGRPVVAVVDARRGEVFWAVYMRSGAEMAAVASPQVSPPEELGAEIQQIVRSHGSVLLVGDGARRYLTQLGGSPEVSVASRDLDHPSPEVLAEAASQLDKTAAADLLPLYLRGADVRIGWEQRDG
jgi:tRNA threonylcarbamoyladenosine biosynthesis protein TsaB